MTILWLHGASCKPRSVKETAAEQTDFAFNPQAFDTWQPFSWIHLGVALGHGVQPHDVRRHGLQLRLPDRVLAFDVIGCAWDRDVYQVHPG